MSNTNCHLRIIEGVLDMRYLERRLDTIEARIDDLCGLLAEVLERIDRGPSVTIHDTISSLTLWSDDKDEP